VTGPVFVTRSRLRDTDPSVAEICWDVGLTSVGSFTSSFTRT
jgi:hypothetical protein